MSTFPSEFVPDGPQSPQTLIETESLHSTAGAEASHPARNASEVGQHAAHVAKEETRKVAAEAGTQARNLLHDAGGELREQAAAQQERLAGGLRSLSSQLSEMADNSSDQGVASDLARQAGERARAVAQWLEAREPGSLVDEVKTFARQRPGVFLGIAAGAGLLAGRLTKALAAPPSPGPRSSTVRQDMPDPDMYRSTDSYDR
jgi:hypothetical protein